MGDEEGPASKVLKLENLDAASIENIKMTLAGEGGSNRKDAGLKEEILTEDEDNIVGIISQFDETKDALEEDLDDPSLPKFEVKVDLKPGMITYAAPARKKVNVLVQPEVSLADARSAFTDQEDMALHALDLISPFDINFISSHMPKRTAKDIERRLDDNEFRKKYFLFQKIPSFLFCITFSNNKQLKFRSLMLVSETLISNLLCVQKTCVHGSDIPEVFLDYDGKSKLGFHITDLVTFINENCPERFKAALEMTEERLEGLFVESKISFHRYGTAIGHMYNKKKSRSKTSVSLRVKECPMLIQGGRLTLTDEHCAYLVKIVSAIGKKNWDMVLTLIEEIFGRTRPTIKKDRIVRLLRDEYLNHLDPDIHRGQFTEDEDKCLLMLYKQFYQSCVGNMAMVWKGLARHMPGRTETECKERLSRQSTNKYDLTLDNLDLEDVQEDVPSIFYYNDSHVFALTVIPKEIPKDLDIPTKLQMESRFLVAGTLDEIFILPCQASALRCSHQGMHTMSFTYNPAKPDSQFETYVKLTFANELKRRGLIDPEMDATFNFSQINYSGKGIHAIVEEIETNRFIVPRDLFIMINEKEDLVTTGGKRGFANEKIYSEER